MCYYTLETYHSCTNPDHHHPQSWIVKPCNLVQENTIQCPDIQYKPSLDRVPCPICQHEASASGKQVVSFSSPGPEFVGEFSMRVQIAHMKAAFDRRREEEWARLCGERFDGAREQ